MRICSKCQQEKEDICFYRYNVCKNCVKKYMDIYNQKYYATHKKELIQSVRLWRKNNKEKRRKSEKLWKKKNKEKIRAWRQAHKKEISISQKRCYKKNLVKRKLYAKKYRESHRDEIKTRTERWRKKNLEKICIKNIIYRQRKDIKERRNLLAKERRKTDIKFKLLSNLRIRLNDTIQRGDKSATTIKLLGCSIEEFKNHLESRFIEDMNWKNYGKGGWHIDHIKPCCSFDLSKAEEQQKCFHFTNLQPLWEIDNLRKSSKFIDFTNE